MTRTALSGFGAGILGILLALFGSGCVQIEEIVTVNADGSGRFHIIYGMAEQTLAQLDTMRQMARQMDEAQGRGSGVATNESLANPFPFDERTVRALLKPYEARGIAIENVKISSRNKWKYVDLNLTFSSLSALAEVKALREIELSYAKTEEGNHQFGERILGGAEPVDVYDPQTEKNLGSILGGLKISVTVNTPGRILTTNASRHMDRTAYWDVDFEKDPQVMRRFQQEGLALVFERTSAKGEARPGKPEEAGGSFAPLPVGGK